MENDDQAVGKVLGRREAMAGARCVPLAGVVGPQSPVSAPGSWEFTSQLFFPDSLTDSVHAQQLYPGEAKRALPNCGDGIDRNGGAPLMLATQPTPAGFGASFDLVLDGA